MPRKVQLPCKAEIKATGEMVEVRDEGFVAGIATYSTFTRRGKYIGDFRRDAIILRPSR